MFKEGSQVSSSLAAVQAEREVLLRSARERDAEIASLKQQAQQQQGYQDLERDRLNRELEALRAQLQQQVSALVVHRNSLSVVQSCRGGLLLFERCHTLVSASFPQLNINAEQKLEMDRLKRELEMARADLARANSSLQSRELVRVLTYRVVVRWERSVVERFQCSTERHPAEQHTGRSAGGAGGAAALREGAGGRAGLPETAGPAAPQLGGDGAAEEQRGAGEPAGPAAAAGTAQDQRGGGEATPHDLLMSVSVSTQAYRESELAQKLQEEQFSLLQCAVVEAEGIILDAASKLDDPIHLCCISSPGENQQPVIILR